MQHLSKETNQTLNVSINFVKLTWNIVLTVLDTCHFFYLTSFSGCNIKKGKKVEAFFTSPWNLWQSCQIVLCSKNNAHYLVLYVASATYGHLHIVEKNTYFKSVQQWFPEWEKWYLQKHLVLPDFHPDMSNSIVDIDRWENIDRALAKKGWTRWSLRSLPTWNSMILWLCDKMGKDKFIY